MKYILALALLVLSLNAKHLHYEKYYQKIFCNKMGGEIEYVLSDKTRVDCLTSSYAIEVDFAPKWAESIGQSLYYGLMTKKKAGVLLILENGAKDRKYLSRLIKVADEVDITIWTIDDKLIVKRIR